MKVFVYLCIAVIIAVAECGVIPSISETSDSVIIGQQPQPVFAKNTDEYDPNPQYNFAYDIQDEITGDSKSQSESRNGDLVRGQYALNDPDGFRRTVDYVADPVNGFNAIVSREPLGYTASAVATPVIKSHEPSLGAAVIKHHNQYQPLNYISSPALTLKTATLTNPAIQSPAIYPAHATYSAPASLKLTPSALIRSGVLSAGAGPTLVKSTPLVYSAQPVLTSPYAAGETIVKSSYSSPFVSYSY